MDELYHAKSEEGLSRLLAFLREEEERERLEQIERMKPIGTQVLMRRMPLLFGKHQAASFCVKQMSHAATYGDVLKTGMAQCRLLCAYQH